MHLKKLFNKNYFLQNLLKSKAAIATFIGLIPILNVMLLCGKDTSNILIPDLLQLSMFNMIGLFVIPVIVSICLFGYIFKRKSVDFINSMPLSRKTIFITNSIGGAVVIILMMLVTTILMGVVSLIFSKLIIPFNMLLDYFIVWTISYLFVFAVSNIAASISGNIPTMIVAALVILFFVPFLHTYATGFAYKQMYVVDNNVELINESWEYENPYEKLEKEEDYTMPYKLATYVLGTNSNKEIYSERSIIKMIILTVIYFFVGLYLFDNRKMEVNETSFKNIHCHFILKCCTLVPILALAITLIRFSFYSFTLIIFAVVLVIAYWLIYDLITTKSIKSIKIGSMYFVSIVVISIILNMSFIKDEKYYSKPITLDIKDITSVAICKTSLIYPDYSNNNRYTEYMNNDRLVKLVKDSLENPIKDRYLAVSIKLKDGSEYSIELRLSEETYDEIIDIIVSDESYLKEYREINNNNVLKVEVGDEIYTGDKAKEIMQKVKDNLYKLAEAELDNEYFYIFNIEVTVYENHELKKYVYPINISDEIFEEFVSLKNKQVKKLFSSGINLRNIRFSYMDYIDSYYYDSNEDKVKDILIKYIKTDIDKPVDITKNFKVLRFYLYIDSKMEQFVFFTNNFEELDRIIKKTLPISYEEIYVYE